MRFENKQSGADLDDHREIKRPGDLPDTGIKPEPPVAPALARRFFTTEP